VACWRIDGIELVFVKTGRLCTTALDDFVPASPHHTLHMQAHCASKPLQIPAQATGSAHKRQQMSHRQSKLRNRQISAEIIKRRQVIRKYSTEQQAEQRASAKNLSSRMYQQMMQLRIYIKTLALIPLLSFTTRSLIRAMATGSRLKRGEW